MFKFVNIFTLLKTTLYAALFVVFIIFIMITFFSMNTVGPDSLGALIPIVWATEIPWWVWLAYFLTFDFLFFGKVKRIHVNTARRIMKGVEPNEMV